jgi:DNA-binding FadR family transcriptional regulator
LGGELAAGERLLPERELAASLGASRVTVRSALDRLASARLVSARQGSGYVVRDYRREGGPALLPGLIELADGQRLAHIAGDLLLVRRKLAAAVLEKLMEVSTTKSLAAASKAVDELARRAENEESIERIAEADLEVTACLLAATKSPVLALCLNPVASVLRDLPALREAMYRAPHENVAGWRALLAWCESREPGLIPLAVAELERRDAATIARFGRRGAR